MSARNYLIKTSFIIGRVILPVLLVSSAMKDCKAKQWELSVFIHFITVFSHLKKLVRLVAKKTLDVCLKLDIMEALVMDHFHNSTLPF